MSLLPVGLPARANDMKAGVQNPAELFGKDCLLCLDLGAVHVIAQVKLGCVQRWIRVLLAGRRLIALRGGAEPGHVGSRSVGRVLQRIHAWSRGWRLVRRQCRRSL